jgi:predicted PurR-regulated permease PerM
MPGRSGRAAPVPRPPLLRLTTRSVVLSVAAFGATLLLLRVIASAERVIGWMLVAAAVAGLLHPAVERVARRVPRALAVLAVVLLAGAVVAVVVYGVVDGVRSATGALQDAAPDAAREIEQSDRFGELARSIDLANRTERFVDDIPQKLRGGSTPDAIRAAATRGVAFLTTSVLTLFLILHGQRLAEAAFAQLPGEQRRRRWREVASRAYRRGFGYARLTLLVALLAGLLAYAAARAAGVPGAAALAVWVALWDIVPLVGAVVGGAPIVVLAFVDDPAKGGLLLALLVAYQAFEDLAVEPRLEAATMRLGPFLTLAAGLVGFELRGATGALLAVLLAALVAAAVSELTIPGAAADEAAPR